MVVFNDDENPASTLNKGSTKGLVKIQKPAYSRDDVALTADEVTAVIELNAAPSAVVREGLDLVVVLDVSGSMQGERLESMKQSMQFVIMKLTPVDRLSVVTFSSHAQRLCPLRSMTESAQKEVKAIIDGLKASGTTNIKSGLEIARQVVAERSTKKSRTANVFLMSDGVQSAGEATDVDLGSASVYTFGLGKDTDHKLLNAIAKKSPGGTFSTVRDGANLTRPFSQMLGGLLTVVAQDVKLTLTPKTEEDGLKAMVVPADTDYTQTTDSATGVITINFGTLFSGESRKVTVTMTLSDCAAGTTRHDAVLAEAQHSYTAQSVVHGLQTPENLKIYRTQNPATVAGSKARWVLAELARRRQAQAIRDAMALAEAGDLDGARYKLVEAQNALEDLVLDDGQKLIDSLRAELAQLIKLMATKELYEAQGRPYALASDTSHARQRYADRGDETDAVRLFATARMDTYLKQAKQFDSDPTKPLPSAADDVKEEIAANPMAAFSSELAVYLQKAIEALQAIEKMINPTTTA
ncbi:hypothetical protein CFC21_023560 [Triticum aestivum]|uniref:VWFA domain-containing protein n=2 Tax=Triticum aestivum TaxID=4565 RepID=A0A9R1EF25_WHEAT|nr:E3 ubiquitin-protein ligase WAV3-like [Triticum aestivum]KAF7008911.1 hypothetical protein CFC21_023560 [Triticum aestivum]CDM86906.1 unnamed protein product [Triticum aestivum]